MIRTPDRAAVVTVAFLAADAGIALFLGAPWAAVTLGGMAVAAGVLFWHVPAIDDDMTALADAVRECGACSPRDRGPCACTRYCGVIRCHAGFDGMPPTPPRIPGWATREDMPDHVPAEWTRENTE